MLLMQLEPSCLEAPGAWWAFKKVSFRRFRLLLPNFVLQFRMGAIVMRQALLGPLKLINLVLAVLQMDQWRSLEQEIRQLRSTLGQ